MRSGLTAEETEEWTGILAGKVVGGEEEKSLVHLAVILNLRLKRAEVGGFRSVARFECREAESLQSFNGDKTRERGEGECCDRIGEKVRFHGAATIALKRLVLKKYFASFCKSLANQQVATEVFSDGYAVRQS